jgi:hypothetical protein
MPAPIVHDVNISTRGMKVLVEMFVPDRSKIPVVAKQVESQSLHIRSDQKCHDHLEIECGIDRQCLSWVPPKSGAWCSDKAPQIGTNNEGRQPNRNPSLHPEVKWRLGASMEPTPRRRLSRVQLRDLAIVRTRLVLSIVEQD